MSMHLNLMWFTRNVQLIMNQKRLFVYYFHDQTLLELLDIFANIHVLDTNLTFNLGPRHCMCVCSNSIRTDALHLVCFEYLSAVNCTDWSLRDPTDKHVCN